MKNDESAFPEIRSERDQNGINDVYSIGGMSLRDYFAGQSLTGIISGMTSHEYKSTGAIKLAEWAYQDADAMLKVREKGE